MQLSFNELRLLGEGLRDGNGFSIITNFGCDMNCWFCIWKKHPMCKLQEPTDFEKLKQALTMVSLYEDTYGERVKVSISGGGDPLFGFPKTADWYEELFKLTKLYGLFVSLHTAKWTTAYNDWILEKLDEVVVHFTYKRFLEWPLLLEEFSKKIPLRMAFVLTSEWSESMMRQVVARAQGLDCKISFRELWAIEDEVRPEALKYAQRVQEEYSQARYVKQDDYNLYFMPDNNIHETFMLGEVNGK